MEKCAKNETLIWANSTISIYIVSILVSMLEYFIYTKMFPIRRRKKNPIPHYVTFCHRFVILLLLLFSRRDETCLEHTIYTFEQTNKIAPKKLQYENKIRKNKANHPSCSLTCRIYNRTTELDMYIQNTKWEPGNNVRARQNNSQGHSANRNILSHPNTYNRTSKNERGRERVRKRANETSDINEKMNIHVHIYKWNHSHMSSTSACCLEINVNAKPKQCSIAAHGASKQT